MEKQVIYGVFTIDIELPKVTNKETELKDFAKAMQAMSYTKQQTGRFIKAYKRLEDAVTYCYEANGQRIEKKLETPDGVNNGKVRQLYYPMVIEVNV